MITPAVRCAWLRPSQEAESLLSCEQSLTFLDVSHKGCKAFGVFTLDLDGICYEPYLDSYHKTPYYKPDLHLIEIIGKGLRNEYLALRLRQEWEMNNFPLFFSFDKEQFKKMLEKMGFTENDTDKIVSIGAGGYLRKSDKEAYLQLCRRHKQERLDAIAADSSGEGYIYHMFRYELANHEYGYTGDASDTLRYLGIPEDALAKNKALMHGYKKAIKKYKF